MDRARMRWGLKPKYYYRPGRSFDPVAVSKAAEDAYVKAILDVD